MSKYYIITVDEGSMMGCYDDLDLAKKDVDYYRKLDKIFLGEDNRPYAITEVEEVPTDVPLFSAEDTEPLEELDKMVGTDNVVDFIANLTLFL